MKKDNLKQKAEAALASVMEIPKFKESVIKIGETEYKYEVKFYFICKMKDSDF